MMKKALAKAKAGISPKAAERDPETDSSSDEEMLVDESEKVGSERAATKITKSKPAIPNVVYIGHLPKDCEERELIAFVKQFGRLVQLRLCRSHRTGGSKGYAFARFQSPEVAVIVADTLNGHLLFKKRLVSHVLAPEQIHGKLFSSDARKMALQKKKAQATSSRKPKSTDKMEQITVRLIEGEQKKREQLKAMGIDYDFPGYMACNTDKKDAQQTENSDCKTLSKTEDTNKSTKKRKNSFAEMEVAAEESGTPEKTKKTKAKPHSEKKETKKDKKDKKNRRKSAP